MTTSVHSLSTLIVHCKLLFYTSLLVNSPYSAFSPLYLPSALTCLLSICSHPSPLINKSFSAGRPPDVLKPDRSKQFPGAAADADANFYLPVCVPCLGVGSRSPNRNACLSCTHETDSSPCRRVMRLAKQPPTNWLTHSLPAALISRMFPVQLNLISRRWSWFTWCCVMRERTFERH